MKQAEQSLYPKLSSIYNKILQLVSAILLIIVLMSVLQSTALKNRENLSEHFNFIAKQQLQQGIAGVAVLLEQKYKNKIEQKSVLQHYLDGLSQVNFVKQVHLYDITGRLLISSVSLEEDSEGNETNTLKAKSINDLYGISPHQRNLTDTLTPFVQEIRHTDSSSYKLHGYMRFTIEQSYLTNILEKSDEEQQSLLRLMLLLAGLVGFLLTRGLNRFSRRGYRLTNTTNAADKK
jgi:membrane protein